MKKTITLFSAIAISTALYAQTEVSQGVMRGKDFGVTYALPKTYVEVTATINKVKYTPGELAKYANRYLRLNNVSTEPAEYYELVSISANSVGVPDKDNVYFIKMKERTAAPLVELTDDGIIKSINLPISSTDKEVAKTPSPKSKELNPQDFLTEEILMANSTAKVADLVAKEIYSIRESKNALVRGQADFMPKDGEQMRMMIETLDAQERALTQMFTGKYEVEELVQSNRVVPVDGMNKEVALRFSKKLGVVANDDLSGEPIYVSIQDLKSIEIPVDDKKKVDGVAYNVPGKALITLTMNGKTLAKEEIPITQFGTVEYLAPVLFNKNSTIKVIFNPNTGALTKVDREEGK